MANKAIDDLLKYARMKFSFSQPIMGGDVAIGGATWGMQSTAWRGATWTASDGAGFVGGDCLRGTNWYLYMYNPFKIFLGDFYYTNGYSDAIPNNLLLDVSNDGTNWTSQAITKSIVGGAGATWYGTINSASDWKYLRWYIGGNSDCAELRLTNAYYYK